MAHSDDVRVLGRYTLEEPIATGTTATIWRAHETKTGRQVAVKRFHPHLFADRVARKRMENEAKAARRVHGPTIVSAIDKISTRDEFALVFPFVSGTALSERLLSEPLTAEESASITADVADALSAIHSAGLVHRDVKPGNVLLGDDGRARLLDFGISRTVTDEIEAAGSMTGAGLAIGTLPYMAPEQLSAQPISGATDVFALGVMLYELLAGRRPFGAVTPVALVAEQHVVPARIAGAPAPLVDLSLNALSVDPRSRPSAQQMSAALRGWLALPLAADAPTALVDAAPRGRVAAGPPSTLRGIVPLLAAGAAVVLIAVVALAAMRPSTTPANSTTQPPLAAALAPAASASVSPTQSPRPTGSPVASPSPSPSSVPSAPAAAPKAPTTGVSPKPHRGHRHHGHHHHHHKHHHRH